MRFLLIVLVASSLSAQRYDDRVTVNLVEVPVNVTDWKGAPVEGLTKADFELSVNGAPQPIDAFDIIMDSQEGPRDSAPAQLQRRRLFVLLFDVMNSSPIAIYRAKKAAQQFVDAAPAGDTFAVAVIQRVGIGFVAPFTADRVAVQRAVATLRPPRSGDSFSIVTLEGERKAYTPDLVATQGAPDVVATNAAQAHEAGPYDVPEISEAVFFQLSPGANAIRDSMAKWEAIEAVGDTRLRDRGIENLAALAAHLAPISGIKHVVLLREAEPENEEPPSWRLAELHEKYRQSGVVLDAVDIGGLKAPWNWNEIPLDRERLLMDLALGTGGTVAPSLASLRKTQRVTYVLAFRPPETSKTTGNKIAVRLRKGGLVTNLRYRSSYSLTGNDKSDNALFLADVIQNDIPQGGMTVDLNVEGTTVTARVPGVEVLANGDDGETTLEVFLYVFDEHGVAVDWTTLRLRIDHEKGREFLSTHPYSIRKQFKLQPGHYSAKALLHVAGKDVTGFRRVEFAVPEATAGTH
jgi:VWFA-related protein